MSQPESLHTGTLVDIDYRVLLWAFYNTYGTLYSYGVQIIVLKAVELK